jgi:colanic acid/amylovoran biosynthesis glycosyltransferase
MIIAHESEISVLHSLYQWLPITQGWMYTQICQLPPHIQNWVVAEDVINPNLFPIAHLTCLASISRSRWAWEKLLRKVGLCQSLPIVHEQARSHHAQILHSHFGHYGWANLDVARRLNLKHVVTFYGFDVHQLVQQDPRWQVRYQSLFEQIDMVLCEGPHMAQCLIALGCPSHKAKVHHLGITLEKFPFQPRKWHPGEPLKVLIAASFREKKGIPDAIAALGQLQPHTPLEITIVGDAGPDKASQIEKRRILETVQQYGLTPTFMGYQPHSVFLEQAYRHHLFISPSVTASDGDTEGGAPVSIIEVAATGMPVVATQHCDIPEVLNRYPADLLAPERNVAELVRILNRWVGYPQGWEDILLPQRAYVEAAFDATIQGARLAEVYTQVMACTSKGGAEC